MSNFLGNSPVNIDTSSSAKQLTKKTPQVESYRVEKLNAVDEIRHPMPRLKHLKQIGQLIWSPDPLVSVWHTTVTTPTNEVRMLQDPVKIVMTGQSFLVYPGLNIQIPSNGLMQFLMHINTPDYLGDFYIVLTNEGGYSYTTNYRQNAFQNNTQKTFQIWNPDTDANYVCAGANSYPSGDHVNFFSGSIITQIELRFNSPSGGTVLYIDGLYTQTKVTPMICDAPDISSNNVFENFVPLYKAYNWSASLRWMIVNGTYQYSGYGNAAAYLDGFDIFNGSATRATVITTDDAEAELGETSKELILQGLDTPILYSSSGNHLPSYSVLKPVADKYGIKLAKSPNAYHQYNPVGANGLDSPLRLNVTGRKSYQQLVDQTKGIMYVGGFIMYFWHECPKFYDYDASGVITGLSSYALAQGLVAGDELTVSSTASGGSVWYEAMVKICEFRKPFVDDGELLIVDASQLNAVLTGVDR